MSKFERLFEESAVLVSCCTVQPELAKFLTADELASMQNCVDVVRDRAAAARLAAQDLFASSGITDWQLPRKHGRAPDWPPGWTGSLSHSDEYAAAALASRGTMAGVGVDVEPAEPLPSELQDTVIIVDDVIGDYEGDIEGRILFCAKEATYKATYPLDGKFLEFRDVSVNLNSGVATTCHGKSARLSVHIDHRIVVLAEISAVND